jgi:glycosyltransferase involved in cell wall biosynthesis
MRILFVTQVMLDRPFGAPRHVLAVARELARLGHDVTLVAPGRASAPGVRRVHPPASLAAGARMEAALAALVFAEMVRSRPDVAYVRLSASSSLVPLACRVARLPYVVELNGRILDELAHLGRPEPVIELVRASLAAAIRGARALVAVSEKIGRHAVEALGAREASIIPNGADLDAATPGDRDRAKAALGLPSEIRLVTMVGSLAPELRLDLLAEAHRKLSGTGLLVVGDGPGATFVQAMRAATRPSSPVIFFGPRPHAEAILAIRAAHACVNVRDGDLGMRGLEYAAVGRRQVAFEVEDSDRIADLYPEDLRAVILVRERSAPALRRAIEVALDAEAVLGPLPGDAVERARARIGWGHTAAQIAAVLEAARA